jgi:hypothetical protein
MKDRLWHLRLWVIKQVPTWLEFEGKQETDGP